ncbi:Flp pilus assembly protein TadB [Actinoplanes octamycinicus]|uniref:Flp pilus assembly protein TadB n=1 Tax=Actinoplanes octamycinicus TaxID=135948 RepID=A0A7W7GUI3_9ACTN|nr:type II secretion system F family protein [Actinoplanes octamycinicus]MBB4738492.1 Flp pilus assembly protein TadB [Actinoplanes octamycinicus]GIE57613.1 membrane protein [Actinoplanes octamycinicus]
MAVSLGFVLAAVVVLVAPSPASWRAGRRLGRLAKSWLRPGAGRTRGLSDRQTRALVAVFAGVAVFVLVGGWWGVPLGLSAGIGAERYLRRQEPAAVRKERAEVLTDLPLGADLLGAALRAGAPVDRAAAAVADALGGPLGARLRRTARSLRLGGTPAEGWAHLADVAAADRLVSAAVRSSASGGALAGALERLADDLRAAASAAAEARAERAGVLVVVPLGGCFLPAFLLVGVVPALVAMLGGVL